MYYCGWVDSVASGDIRLFAALQITSQTVDKHVIYLRYNLFKAAEQKEKNVRKRKRNAKRGKESEGTFYT